MQNDFQSDMQTVQNTLHEASLTCGRILAAMAISGGADASLANALDRMSAQFESGVISLRNLCEKHRPETPAAVIKPRSKAVNLTGKVEVNHYGWLHMELNTLLPHCRYQTPAWLSDTVTRLLNDYERNGRKLPRFDCAMLVIDEHCDIRSRNVFDTDNRGWKAIPNALKGRLIRDDDQFSLHISLISTRSDTPTCHIYLLPAENAGDFFFTKYGGYPMFP